MSVDTKNVNLLDLLGNAVILKKKGRTNGGEWAGACPFCGGRDRFIVWPNHPEGPRWWCRAEGEGGDSIAYIMRRDNVTFVEALKKLGLGLESRPTGFRSARTEARETKRGVSPEREWEGLTNTEWQRQAWRFVCESAARLFEPAHRPALAHLHDRGFSDAVLDRYMIGYNPVKLRMRWGPVDIYLPRGIVIPWLYDGAVWRVNVRRLDGGTPKYIQATGGANGLYNAGAITTSKPVVLVEGEFDALSIVQAARDLVTPVATGSATGGRLARWLATLAIAPGYCVAYDDDEAGTKASSYWMDVLPRARRLVPSPHDPNDMLRLHRPAGLRQWLTASLHVNQGQ